MNEIEICSETSETFAQDRRTTDRTCRHFVHFSPFRVFSPRGVPWDLVPLFHGSTRTDERTFASSFASPSSWPVEIPQSHGPIKITRQIRAPFGTPLDHTDPERDELILDTNYFQELNRVSGILSVCELQEKRNDISHFFNYARKIT